MVRCFRTADTFREPKATDHGPLTTDLFTLVPAFVLAFFRVAGLFLYAPLLGSSRIPRRVKGMVALVLTLGVLPAVPEGVRLPGDAWSLAAGIAGELALGLAGGLAMSFALVAAQWAGELIGQQMGLQLGETIDPNYGGGGSVVGDLYFFLTLVVFILIGGDRLAVEAVARSFESVPLLTFGLDRPLVATLAAMLASTAELALRLAGPTFVAMLVVDLALGFVGKTMPQMNLMTAGLSARAVVGIAVLILGVALTYNVLQEAVAESIDAATAVWTTPPTPT